MNNNFNLFDNLNNLFDQEEFRTAGQVFNQRDFRADMTFNHIINGARQSIHDALVTVEFTAESAKECNRYKYALIMIDNIRDAVKDGRMLHETGALILSNLMNVLGIETKEE